MRIILRLSHVLERRIPNSRRRLLTGVTDGLFSSILSVAFYGSTVSRLFQGVASVLLGPEALSGGISAMFIGILMHFGVAFAWTIAFALLLRHVAPIRRLASSAQGVAIAAALYGPLVWTVMSMVVIPLMTRRPPSITSRWWTQFFGHIIFVGLPIVVVTRGIRPSR